MAPQRHRNASRRRTVRLAAVLLLGVSLLAGCATPEAPQEPAQVQEPEASAPAIPATVEEAPFGWEAGAGIPGTGLGTQAGSRNAVSPDVPAGTARMIVNVTWTCLTPTCDLQAYVWAPGTGPGNNPPTSLLATAAARAEGPSPLQLVIEAPAAGEWAIGAFDSGVAATVDGTFQVTLVPLPPGEAPAAAEPHHA